MKKRIIGMLLLLRALAFFGFSGRGIPSEDFLMEELKQLEGYLQHQDSLNIEISKVDVAWHLDHTLKVINGVCDSLEASDPKKYEARFNVLRVLSFTTGNIPRGKGKAPKSVTPPEVIGAKDLRAQLDEARESVSRIGAYPEKAHFRHPVFGVLNRKRTKKFLKIHTDHHLSIIKDILNEKE